MTRKLHNVNIFLLSYKTYLRHLKTVLLLFFFIQLFLPQFQVSFIETEFFFLVLMNSYYRQSRGQVQYESSSLPYFNWSFDFFSFLLERCPRLVLFSGPVNFFHDLREKTIPTHCSNTLYRNVGKCQLHLKNKYYLFFNGHILWPRVIPKIWKRNCYHAAVYIPAST